jgi:hypothetical protein
MLLAKLLLVSSRIAAETLAGRCFGPAVAAWLTSTLIVVGPIVVVLALLGGHPKPANEGQLKTGQRRR